MDELYNRSEKVSADPSGEYARQWLADKGPGKPAKLTDKEFWDVTSGPPHGTVRAVLDWLAISAEDGATQISVGPELLPARANATLAHLCFESAAVGWRLSTEAGLKMSWTKLHAASQQAMDTYLPEPNENPGRVTHSPSITSSQ